MWIFVLYRVLDFCFVYKFINVLQKVAILWFLCLLENYFLGKNAVFWPIFSNVENLILHIKIKN